jgi:hypothetical protein
MSCQTILVCLDLHRSNKSLMTVSASLATQLNAKVVGIVGSQPLLIAAENMYVPSDVFDAPRMKIAQFAAALPDR